MGRHSHEKQESLNPIYVASCLEEEAAAQLEHGFPKAALQALNKALAIRRQQVPATEHDVLDMIGKAQMQLGNYAEAGKAFEEAIAIVTARFYPDHPLIIPMLDDWVRSCLNEGELVKAEELCKRSLELKHKSLLPTDVHTVETARTLADIQRRLERYGQAEALVKQTLKYVEPSTIGPVEEFYFELALIYQDQGQSQKAEEYYKRALPIFAERVGKIDRFAACMKSYASLLRATGRGRQANLLDEEAESLSFVSAQPVPDVEVSAPLFEEFYACTILH